MDNRLTRENVYELVWSEPVIQVAARFGVSGVALAKACRRHHIPVPPRGYWARLQAGKRSWPKIPLPPRSLGGSDRIELGRRHWHLHAVSDEQLITTEIPPPREFPESLPDLTARVNRLVGKVRVPKDLSNPHRIISKLLETEALRRKARSYPTEPLFDSPFEQRRLKFLSALFNGLDHAGMRPSLNGQDPKHFGVRVGEQDVSFTLDSPGSGQRIGYRSEADSRRPALEALQLVIEGHRDRGDLTSHWQDKAGDRIEHHALEIVIALIVRGELQHRWSEQRHHDWLVERKAHAIEAARKRLEAERRAVREARIRAEQARVQRLLDEAAAYRQANDIRAYVQTVLQATTILAAEGDFEEVQGWAAWATAQAERIDPIRSRSFLRDLDRQPDGIPHE